MAIGANNLLMLALSNYRRKLFDLQTFQNQAHIISVTGIIIYFLGTYYLYTDVKGGIIAEKVVPVFSESSFLACFGLVM